MQAERGSKRSGATHAPVNLKSLKRIVTIMRKAQLTELDIEQEGIRIHLRKGPAAVETAGLAGVNLSALAQPSVPATAAAAQGSAPAAAEKPSGPEAAEGDANVHIITSPMVGTFYRAPAPDAKPYVVEGSEVEEGNVVCIVEAMKLMNEIKAEVKGVIRKILVENAQAVEYGQPLFQVERKG